MFISGEAGGEVDTKKEAQQTLAASRRMCKLSEEVEDRSWTSPRELNLDHNIVWFNSEPGEKGEARGEGVKRRLKNLRN